MIRESLLRHNLLMREAEASLAMENFRPYGINEDARLTLSRWPKPDDWWGEDIVPRVRWKILVDGLQYRDRGVPDFYGVAYRESGRDMFVCYPIPINVIISFVRHIYFTALQWLRFPPWRFTGYREQMIKEEAFDLGRESVFSSQAFMVVESPLFREADVNPYRQKK